MKGYKVFKSDWTCRGFQYKVGKIYEEEVTPLCCKKGFHFCLDLKNCFNYYSFNPNNKVAEIEALGEIDAGSEKCCTNKIKIIRELSWVEVLQMVNTGIGNSGCCNNGNCNSGDYNYGYYNSGTQNYGYGNSGETNKGHYNSGNYNIGSDNSGCYNKGDYNSGYYNKGNYNSGNFNIGNYNSGDWNKTDNSSGCFNIEEPKITMFGKPSNWTYEDWLNSDARFILGKLKRNSCKLAPASEVVKEQDSECKIPAEYIAEVNEFGDTQKWWNGLLDSEKDVIKSLPNFDAEIFKEITGIDVTM